MKTQHVYLGFQNPRQALIILDLQIVILQDPAKGGCVLRGDTAMAFYEAITAVTHHLCGFLMSSDIARLISQVPPHQHDHNVYNLVFDLYFN